MGKINVFKACLLGGLAIAGMPVLAQQSQAPGTNDLVNETRTITIKAQVTNTKGETLPGVHVKVKGSNLGTITDINGNFKLNLPAGHLLVFSYVGYESVETPTDELSDKVVLEENTQSLQEVVVTTQKRQQSSIEIPTAVSALSGKDMAQLNLTQMNQVADFIPGVQIQQQSPNNGGYAIRGVTSDDGAATSQPRVSVFIDGVSNFRTQSSQVELFDMDRVEVVKGPQGTLFGRGAEIGAVNLIRKKPVNYLTGELSLNYGSYNQHGANGFINTPILNDKLLNRLAFSYDTHDGFIKNLSGGRLNGKEAFAIRNSTRLFTGENTTIDVVLDYQHDNYPGTSFKSNRFTPEGDENFDANRPANLEEGNWLGIKRHTGGALFAVNHNLSSAWMLTSTSGFRAYKSDENFDADGTYLPLLKCTENSKGLQFSQEFRMNYNNGGPLTGFFGTSYFYEKVQQGATLQGNMQHLYPAYISSSLKEQFNGIAHTIEGIDFTQISTGNPAIDQLLPVLNQLKPTIVNTLNQYINQSWFPESSTDASQAVSQLPNIWGDLDNTVKGLTQQLVGLPISLDTLLGMVGDAIPTEYQQQLNLIKNISNAPLDSDMHHEDMTNYAENQSVDVFADGTWHIWKGLSATLGIRGTYEHQRSGYSSNSSLTDNPFGMAFLYQPSENGEKVWASKDYFSYVGRFALNYMFERNNVYFNLSRGRRPGVIAFNNNPNDIEKLRPETIWSYEAGIKGNIQNKLFYDFCLYYYDWYNFQSTTMEDNGISKIEVATDGGRAHSWGAEASLRYAVCPFLNVFGNYSYIRAQFNDRDEDGNEQKYAGNTFRLTPKNSFSVGLNFSMPAGKNASFYFIPTYTYKSKLFFEDDNNPLLTQDGYGIANFTAGYSFKPKNIRYEIGAFGRNVLDEKYIIDAGNSGRQIGFPTFVGGTRSVVGLQFKIGF